MKQCVVLDGDFLQILPVKPPSKPRAIPFVDLVQGNNSQRDTSHHEHFLSPAG